MEEFSKYLLKHIILDFGGEVNMEHMNRLLLEDGSPRAKTLRNRLITEGGPDDFLLVLADCLKEHLGAGIDKDVVNSQIDVYLDA